MIFILILAKPYFHHLVKHEIFFPNFINLAVAPFDNAAKLFWKFSWQFYICRVLTIWTFEKKFLILYLLLLYDTFSTRKSLFRIENIFCFNSFDRNTFFLSANLFLIVSSSLYQRLVKRNIFFLYHGNKVASHTLCATGFIFYKILNFLLHTYLVDHKNL